MWIHDRRALVICPGYLWWPGGPWTKDLPLDLFADMHADKSDQWHELSTFRPSTGGPRVPEPPEEICPTCFMALPRTGVCDNCG